MDYAKRAHAINLLYQRRFHRQAPGHDEPAETGLDSNDDENRAQYAEWLATQAWGDMLEWFADREEHERALMEAHDAAVLTIASVRYVVEQEHHAQAIGRPGHLTVGSLLYTLKDALG